jgi:hypothetical protein
VILRFRPISFPFTFVYMYRVAQLPLSITTLDNAISPLLPSLPLRVLALPHQRPPLHQVLPFPALSLSPSLYCSSLLSLSHLRFTALPYPLSLTFALLLFPTLSLTFALLLFPTLSLSPSLYCSSLPSLSHLRFTALLYPVLS